MSVATAVARSAVRSTSTISRAEPRSISANAHACPTAPTPTTPTLSGMAVGEPSVLAVTQSCLGHGPTPSDRDARSADSDCLSTHLRPLKPEVAPWLADHRCGVDDAVEVGRRHALGERGFAEG